MSWLFPVSSAGFACFQFSHGSWYLAASSVAVSLLFARRGLRPPTVVSATGVRRPWRWRRRAVQWADVEAVLCTPLTVFPGAPPSLALIEGGRPVLLDDIPSDQAELVALIGRRPLLRPPLPGVPTAAEVRPREKTRSDIDIEADVVRRAARLDQGWADLETENRHRPRST